MQQSTIEQLLARYIAMRPRSREEVRRYLVGKAPKYKLSETKITSLLDRYTEIGFINDAHFAESLMHSLIVNKAKGQRVLRMKLKLAGVDEDLISSTLAGIQKDDIALALEKRLGKIITKLLALEPRLRRQKAYTYLLSSGFSSSDIGAYIDSLLSKMVQ